MPTLIMHVFFIIIISILVLLGTKGRLRAGFVTEAKAEESML